jgi:hypothetical protein
MAYRPVQHDLEAWDPFVLRIRDLYRNTNSHPLAPSQLYLANNVTLMTACTGFSYCSEMMWEQYVQRLRETSRAAVQASQAKSSFLAVMSHEVLSRRDS